MRKKFDKRVRFVTEILGPHLDRRRGRADYVCLCAIYSPKMGDSKMRLRIDPLGDISAPRHWHRCHIRLLNGVIASQYSDHL